MFAAPRFAQLSHAVQQRLELLEPLTELLADGLPHLCHEQFRNGVPGDDDVGSSAVALLFTNEVVYVN